MHPETESDVEKVKKTIVFDFFTPLGHLWTKSFWSVMLGFKKEMASI